MGPIDRWKQMRSASDTKYRKALSDKLSMLIILWILDKIIMLVMLYMVK